MRKAQSKPYSYENPLKLKKKHQNSELERVKSNNGETYFHRELLQLSTKPNVNTRNTEEPAQFSFLKLKDQSEDCFALNLVSNPNLKPIEIKIALGIYEIVNSEDAQEHGLVFICTTKKLNPESISEHDFIFTDGRYFGFADIIIKPLYELLTELLNTQISNAILNKALKRLDSFHYFSVTPLTPDNFRSNITNKVEHRAYYKHIEVNQHMCRKNLSNYWLLNRDL